MSGKIFINYRRGDEPGFALALYGRLEGSFSPEQLFMDVEGGIPAGHDFVQVLGTQLAQCDVLLALIGQSWLTAADDSGARRLETGFMLGIPALILYLGIAGAAKVWRR